MGSGSGTSSHNDDFLIKGRVWVEIWVIWVLSVVIC